MRVALARWPPGLRVEHPNHGAGKVVEHMAEGKIMGVEKEIDDDPEVVVTNHMAEEGRKLEGNFKTTTTNQIEGLTLSSICQRCSLTVFCKAELASKVIAPRVISVSPCF